MGKPSPACIFYVIGNSVRISYYTKKAPQHIVSQSDTMKRSRQVFEERLVSRKAWYIMHRESAARMRS